MKPTHCLHLLPCLLLSSSLMANALDNPGFDTDLSGWDNLFGRPATWDSLDADGSPDSGSALLTHEGSGGGGAPIMLHQCLQLHENFDYFFGAMVLVPSTEPSGTRAHVVLTLFDNPDCSGFEPTRSIFSSGGFGQEGWQHTGGSFTALPGELSARVNLSITKEAGEVDDASAHFDNVYFNVDLPDEIFDDRFESP